MTFTLTLKFTEHLVSRGRDSSVGIGTGYALDSPGIESRWGRDFPHLFRPVLGPTQPPVQWVPGLSPGVKIGRGVTLNPHPLLVPLVMKGYSYTSTPPMGRTTCTEPQCLYKGALYCTFYNAQKGMTTHRQKHRCNVTMFV